MIVKNGEILAIDHIAHDNTLSGNGTSAKPVGLSQSTKDLIDSKVKQSEFDTYKSSVANQIRDINNTIAADESSLESYKETVAASFTTVNGRITDVANAKQDKGNYVSATNFNDFKNTIEGQIEALETGKQPVGDYVVTNDFNSYKETVDGKFTTVNERITNVANAKQDKGDYVSASDFNTYKTDVAGEIARVDGRIDTTNTNLENNYYKKNQTYSQSEVDEIVSKLGAYVYVENVTSEGYPIVDEPSTKVIYLTQIPNETQCLQWIWLETQEWKCIGDTTMNLSAYATKEWTNNNFETIDQFNTAIANYYTKGEVNTELATKVDNNDFNAYKTEVNGKFATKQSLTDTKAELENDIDSASAEIISKVNTDYGTLNDKIDDIATTLSNDYYTSLEIDAILAASGEYYTKTESDTKYAEKEVFNTAINELSSNKLDKSATANWDVTEYTEGENIKIVGHEISGKDWSNEIAAAVENKVDESELENYYTSNQIDNKFVTKTEFNDLDTLSGKTVTVIKDSETVKAIRSTEPDGTISYTLSAHDGKQADYLWKPTVNAAGDISWELALTGDTPDPANIKGPQGIQGISGTPGKDGITPKLKIDENDIWNVSYDNEATWTSLGVSATGPKGETGAQGPQGISGTPGKNGENGITPHIGDNNHWFIGDHDTGVSATGPQGPQGEEGDEGEPGFSPTVNAVAITDGEKTGTEITFTYKDAQEQTQTTVYSAWNGVNGEGATVHFNGVDGIKITSVDTTHFNVGLSGDYKTAIESISADYATKDALNDYLTIDDAAESYQPKGNYLSANALNGYATETWVVDKHYLVASDIAGKADKTELETVSGEIVGMIPSLNGYATEQYVQGASAEVTAWVNNQHYLTSVPSEYITETELSTELLEYQPKGNYLTEVATSGSVIGTGLATNKIGLVTSAENALKDVVNKANTADVYSKTDADSRYQQKVDMSAYLLSATYASQSGNFVTSALADFSDTSKIYGLQKTNNVVSWTEIEDSISTVETNNYISGDGTVQYPIGLSAEAASAIDAMTDQYQIDGGQYVSVVPNSTTHKVVVGLDNQATNAIADVIASANIWDEASAVSTKSHVTIDNTTNIITTENQGTSTNLSAVEYKDNVNVAGMNVQQIYAVRNDDDIYACLSTTANKGTLFFVCSGIA